MRIAFPLAALLAATALPVAAQEPCEQLVYGGPCRPVAAETPAAVGADAGVQRSSRARVLRPVADPQDGRNRDVLAAAKETVAEPRARTRARRDGTARSGRVLRPRGGSSGGTVVGSDLTVDDSGIIGGSNRSQGAADGTGSATVGSSDRANVARSATAAQSAGGTSAARGNSRGNLGGAASPGGQGGAPAASGSGGIGTGGGGNSGGGGGPG